MNYFLPKFWWKFHSRIFHDSKHFLNFLNKKNATMFFHDSKYSINFLSILKKTIFYIFQKYLPFKAPNFFWKSLKSLNFRLKTFSEEINFKKLVVFKKEVGNEGLSEPCGNWVTWYIYLRRRMSRIADTELVLLIAHLNPTARFNSWSRMS